MSDFLVDGRHGLHVALSPLSSQIFGLDLEELEDVQLHHGLFDLERSLQYGSRLKDHKHLPRDQHRIKKVKVISRVLEN